jgi:hypothetical protein
MLAEISIRNVVTPLSIVLRVAGKLQCPVTSSCVRTAGGCEPASSSLASVGYTACELAGTAPSCINVGSLTPVPPYGRPAAGVGAWVISTWPVDWAKLGGNSAAIMNSVLLSGPRH